MYLANALATMPFTWHRRVHDTAAAEHGSLEAAVCKLQYPLCSCSSNAMWGMEVMSVMSQASTGGNLSQKPCRYCAVCNGELRPACC